jgi:hypothetical protein
VPTPPARHADRAKVTLSMSIHSYPPPLPLIIFLSSTFHGLRQYMLPTTFYLHPQYTVTNKIRFAYDIYCGRHSSAGTSNNKPAPNFDSPDQLMSETTDVRKRLSYLSPTGIFFCSIDCTRFDIDCATLTCMTERYRATSNSQRSCPRGHTARQSSENHPQKDPIPVLFDHYIRNWASAF